MSANNIIKLEFSGKSGPIVERALHVALNFRLVNYIFRSNVHSNSRSELVFLSCRLADDGQSLLGDVVQMSRQQILKYAEADGRIKHPETIVDCLMALLADLGLGLNMRAPEWVRSPQPSFAERIARRNIQMEATGHRRPRLRHLKIVHTDL
jgi:hypothetical protein